MPTAEGGRSVSPTICKPFMVGRDWLHINGRGPWWALKVDDEPMEWVNRFDPTEQWWIVRAKHMRGGELINNHTNVFARILYVMGASGEKLATIWCAPYSRAIGPVDWFQMQFANDTLYTGKWAVMLECALMFGCEYTGMARLDISADGIRGEGGQFTEPFERMMRGEAEYYGKGKWLLDGNRKRADGFTLGTASTDKYVRCYCKSREQKSKGHDKPYITQSWKLALNGRDVYAEGTRVDRFEVRLKHAAIDLYYPEARNIEWLRSLNNTAQLVEVFATMAAGTAERPGIFDFRTSGADRARDAVKLIEWDWTGVSDAAPDARVRAERKYCKTERSIKMDLHRLFELYLFNGNAALLDAVYEVARGADLVPWVDRSREAWIAENQHLLAAKDDYTCNFLARVKANAGLSNVRAIMDDESAVPLGLSAYLMPGLT